MYWILHKIWKCFHFCQKTNSFFVLECAKVDPFSDQGIDILLLMWSWNFSMSDILPQFKNAGLKCYFGWMKRVEFIEHSHPGRHHTWNNYSRIWFLREQIKNDAAWCRYSIYKVLRYFIKFPIKFWSFYFFEVWKSDQRFKSYDSSYCKWNSHCHWF